MPKYKQSYIQKIKPLIYYYYKYFFKPDLKGNTLIDTSTDLDDYQRADLKWIIKVIYENFPNPGKISVLDVGCSADELLIISKYVKKYSVLV